MFGHESVPCIDCLDLPYLRCERTRLAIAAQQEFQEGTTPAIL